MIKLVATVSSVLVSLGLAAWMPAQPPPPDGPPPPKAKIKAKGKGEPKKKGEREPGGELSKAYDLLRRLRADDSSGARPEERLRDWTDRAAGLYRMVSKHSMPRTGVSPASMGPRPTTWHGPSTMPAMRSAMTGPTRTCRLLRMTLVWKIPASEPAVTYTAPMNGWDGSATARPPAPRCIYIKAARDLYNAARRDLEAGRDERGGELARAAEAMTHVPEHLAQVGDEPGRFSSRPAPPPPPERPEPKKEREPLPRDRRAGELPPALPPG